MKHVTRALIAGAFYTFGTSTVFADQVVLREGTEIRVSNRVSLTSKKAVTGDPVDFVVDQAVSVGGVVIIPAGTPAYGQVSNAERNGHLGQSGKLDLTVNYVRIGDEKVRVRGARASSGNSGTGATIATTVLLGPLGLLVHGKSANVPAGTQMTVYLEQDLPVIVDGAVAAVAPAMIHVPATTQPVTVVHDIPSTTRSVVVLTPAAVPTPQ
jgi:hypothetical protein